MAWTIELSETARRSLSRLDRQMARRITGFLATRIASVDNPRLLGKALHARLGDYWAYRVGDYRLVCDIQDNRLIVLVVDIGHRSDIYR